MFMSANAYGVNRYATVSVQSGIEDATPHQLIQMLLKGALERIAQARGALERKDHPKKGELISKAIAIIGGMQEAVDVDQGGELGERLFELYGYMQERLVRANANNDPGMLDEVSALLTEIKEAWDAIPPEYHHVSGGG